MITKTISILKITGYVILFCAIAFGLFLALTNIQSCNRFSFDSFIPTKIDTVLDVRYYETVKHDTTIRVIEKPLYVKAKTVFIEYKKVDTVFIENAKKLDLVLSLKKTGSRIDAYTINFNDTLLKKTMFVNVGNDFVLTSQAGKVYIKSKRFYWNGLNAAIIYQQPLDSNVKKFSVHNFAAELSTGINYMDMLSIDAGFRYSHKQPQHEINAFAKLNYRFSK